MLSNDARAIADYHERTKHSPWSVRSSRHVLDWDNQPLPFKLYRDLEPIPLPRSHSENPTPALAAIAQEVPPDERIPRLGELARVFDLGAGITKEKRHPGGSVYFRAYPNTGALYHVDVYLVCGELPDLSAGVYHFGPHDFSLRRLREGDWRGVLVEASGRNPELAQAPAILASASTYWRNSWKYQARAWRHCFWDAGTLHANLLAVAASEGLAARVLLGWADRPVERLLGLDPLREGALTLVPLGRSADPVPPAREMPELHHATEPLSREAVDYPEIREAQAASSLMDGAQAAAWRSAAHRAAASDPRDVRAGLLPLRPTAAPERSQRSLDRVVRRRGSTRAFDATRSISFEELSTALDRATRGVAADYLEPGASLLDLYLIVNAVDGLDSGAYRYHRDSRCLELLRKGDFRRAAGGLGLGQALPADAAVDIYSLTRLPELLERFGGRGYRAAQLEGGITGGRLYLAAYAQGFGATGLTFFDDEVTEFFSPSAAGASVMFLVALGRADRAALGLAP